MPLVETPQRTTCQHRFRKRTSHNEGQSTTSEPKALKHSSMYPIGWIQEELTLAGPVKSCAKNKGDVTSSRTSVQLISVPAKLKVILFKQTRCYDCKWMRYLIHWVHCRT